MGCLKLSYHDQEPAISENWKIFAGGIEKNASAEKKRYDYYPFGSIMPGRKFNAGDYRFGMHGMEKDDEWRGITGADYDFSGYGYDALTGRRKRPDPLAAKYPRISPYAAFNNNPILYVDPDGKEIVIVHLSETQQNQYNAQISKLRAEDVYFDVLYSMLESSDIKYYITEGQRTQVAGSFVPGINNKGEKVATGGNVDFKSFGFDQGTAMEEFFHAFQNETYADKGSYNKLSDVGGNVEFEAKFLKLMVDINKGGLIMVFPDIEGLNDIVYDLIEKYDLTDDQKQGYFNALNTFIDYHKQQKDQIEKETGKRPKDLYDAPATEQKPDAAFKVLKAGDKKKKAND